MLFQSMKMIPTPDMNLLQEIAKNIRTQKHAMKNGEDENNKFQ